MVAVWVAVLGRGGEANAPVLDGFFCDVCEGGLNERHHVAPQWFYFLVWPVLAPTNQSCNRSARLIFSFYLDR